MSHFLGPLLLQIVLIFLNAVFAMAEIAVISISDARLSKSEEEGDRRAGKLLRLKSDPAKFLATIQVAITLSGFLGSAFAADHFSEYLVALFGRLMPGVSEDLLDGISVVLITLALSYLSLIFGELVPKRVAMRKTEKMALGLSGTVSFVSKAFAPIVWFLTVSTNGVLRLLGIDPHADEEEVSEEDILMMADAGAEKGTIDEEEREIIENVFRFDDITVGELTTHRTDVVLLWAEESDEEWANTIRTSRYTTYPICDGAIDNVVGVLNTKDYFRLKDQSRKSVMANAVTTPYFVPEGAKADLTFRNMKAKGVSFAVVLDEYAGFSGILTIKDLVECIVGDIASEEEKDEEELQQIGENQWRVSGNVSLSVMSKTLDLEFPDEYETFSGLVMSLLGAVPDDGTHFFVETEAFSAEITHVKDHQVVGAVITITPKAAEEEK